MKKIFAKFKELKIQPVLFLIIVTFYLELLFKFVLVNHVFNIGLIYTFIYSIPIFVLFTILNSHVMISHIFYQIHLLKHQKDFYKIYFQ